MTRKKIKPVDQYAFLTINVDKFSSAVNMSVNGQARDRRQDNDNVSLYSFGCDVEIQGTCTYPPERVHENYRIDISTKPQSQLDFDAKLKDTRVRDEDGSFKYHKVRGRFLPVYDIPEGLGLLDKERGTTNWNGWLWVPEQTLTQMLILLTNVKPLYLEVHERKIGRTRWINGVRLQMTDPNEE